MSVYSVFAREIEREDYVKIAVKCSVKIEEIFREKRTGLVGEHSQQLVR